MPVKRSYRNKTVVITGAAGGLGRALAGCFARQSARLALLDLDADGLQAAAQELEAEGHECLALPCDITDEQACADAVARAAEALGGPDVLVNNAGLTQRSNFDCTGSEVFRKVMEVNFFGSLYCTQAALPALLTRRGQIIVISSIAGLAPLYGRTGYSASKHALHGLFGSLRSEVQEQGVGVTIACPGFIDTDFSQRALDGDGGVASHPRSMVGGEATPQQVAQAIFRAASRDQALLVLSATGHASRWLSTFLPSLHARIMARKLKQEL